MVRKLNESTQYKYVTFDDTMDTLKSCYDKIDFARVLLYSILSEPGGEKHDFSKLSQAEKNKIARRVKEVQVASEYCLRYLDQIKEQTPIG